MICYYSQNTSDAECAGFSHQAILQLSTDTNSGCPTIEFNSDSNYLELVQTPPPRLRAEPLKTAPTSDASHNWRAFIYS